MEKEKKTDNPRLKSIKREPNILVTAIEAFVAGDWAVKCSALIMGIGYIARKQIIKGLLVTLYQVAILAFIFKLGSEYLVDFGTLGTVQFEAKIDFTTMQTITNDYDNSFTILLFSVVTLCSIVVFIGSWFINLRAVYNLQKQKEAGKHINNFWEEVKSYTNEKFHITLLSLPVLGVVVFTIVPLLVLIAVAFTNYDINHLTPANLFDWVGFANFKSLFGTGMTATFGYSFRKVLVWTLIWAFFATFSNYFLGIMLAKFLLNKKTKFPKFWRSIFVVTIAIPQFVTLLIVRYFFLDAGIANTILAQWGVTDLLKEMGLVASHLDYVPFLSDPIWAKVMIILINIWVGVPYQMLIATGVLLNIPQDMVESAKIDGANSWQSFWRITMPYMFAVTGPTLVTDFVRNINNFNVVYLLTQDVYVTTDMQLAASQAREIDLLVTWLFRLTQENSNYKMASVIGIIVFVICAIFTLVSFRFLTNENKEKEFQ